jgi:hypothetical protein
MLHIQACCKRIFHIDVAKVDRDVAHVAMAIQSMFQVYVVNVSSVSNVLCESRFGCCIYKHVASVFFKWFQMFCKCFIWTLRIFVMIFKCLSSIFVSVSDAYFKCFICLLCMLQLLHLDVLKVDQVAHGMCVGSAWRGPAVGALTHKPDALGCSLAH